MFFFHDDVIKWKHFPRYWPFVLRVTGLCVGNSLVIDEFPTQRPVTRSFDVFFDLRLNKRLSKQSWGCWFEMLSCPLWRHHNAKLMFHPAMMVSGKSVSCNQSLPVHEISKQRSPVTFNTLRPRQNGRHFTDNIFKCSFLNENVWILINISLKVVPKGPINNIPALVQIMAWRRIGDKPLSEPKLA